MGVGSPIHGPSIYLASEGEIMGERRSLVYYNSKKKISTKKTRWIMNEYRLLNPRPPSCPTHLPKDPFWTLCKIGETEEPLVMMIKFFLTSARTHLAPRTSEARLQAYWFITTLDQLDDNGAMMRKLEMIKTRIENLESTRSNFDSWMETIKKRGHDEQQQQVDEEEDEPSLKRAKARVAN
ncbi:hypothetical protein Syun_019726 [Stephania yunnanensis]|uniref:NAC domain-containing protein n=1 Tax=Stephania yunnanensis TaxID=152371 RepID=A0AAP0NXP0_9MAGN